ncbi:diguanylate cyclase [Yoonia sp. R2331]|uniref:diguanylate cyclase domain-containing protein n=1 Tax=Yoonia sp. R2331 TaxID=3237238 RepID=UPI0034E57DA5
MSVQSLNSQEERFRKRALSVYISCLVIFVAMTAVQRFSSEAANEKSWIPFILVTAFTISASVCVYRRWHAYAVSRVALYVGGAETFFFTGVSGGLTGFHASAVFLLPSICALLFGSKETVVFTIFMLLGVYGLYVFDPVLPPFFIDSVTDLRLSALALGCMLMGNVIILVYLVRETEHREKELRELLAAQLYAATHDELTGLANRSAVKSYLNGLDPDKDEVSIYLIDLDGFKHVNDTYGHGAGDEVLVKVARALQKAAAGSNLVARLGGDEFLIASQHAPADLAAQLDATGLGRKLVDALNVTLTFGSDKVTLSGSVGSAHYPSDTRDAADVLQKADVALYRAKDMGKARYVRFLKELEELGRMRA